MNTNYKVRGFALEIANAFGYLFPAELFLLQAIGRSIPTSPTPVFVCIGVGTGTGSLGLAEVQPVAKIYSIDISAGGPNGGLKNEQNAFANTGLHLPIQILGDSKVVYKRWPELVDNKDIDVLFIDGDHSEDGLQGDIDGWLKFVKVGGYVLYHDYGSNNWGDVVKIVDRNMTRKEWRRVLIVDTLIAFVRMF